MATAKITKSKINPNQEAFCQYYISEEFFCNGVKSYMKAYPDSEYNTAKNEASVFLTNPYILKRINELLDAEWFNDQYVDKQLFKLVAQDDDKSVKLWWIREYNKLKSRITEKIETKTTWEIDVNVINMTPEDVDRQIKEALK